MNSALADSSAPLVSVIIPAYNCEQFIATAIDSVLCQDYLSIEIIVVDDGSTDATRDVVRRFGSPVRLLTQDNAGAAAARNTGMKYASGKYIAFLDADDIWRPGKLRLQVCHLEDHETVGICCTRWKCLFPAPDGSYDTDVAAADDSAAVDSSCSGWIYCKLLLDCEVWTSTVLMRRDLYQRIGNFDETLRRGQDYDYWLRASQATIIDRLSAETALYRMDVMHDRKFPDTNWGLIVIRRALDRWGNASPDGQKLPPAVLARRLWQLNFQFGLQQYRCGRFAIASSAFLEALRERPTHLPTMVYRLVSSLRSKVHLNRG